VGGRGQWEVLPFMLEVRAARGNRVIWDLLVVKDMLYLEWYGILLAEHT
jgi:hypothetical protein